MFKCVFKYLLFAVCLVLFGVFSNARSEYTLATMPRIDVHAHIGSLEGMAAYMEVGKVLKEDHKVNLDIWIDLQTPLKPGGKGADFMKEVQEKYKGRFLPCIHHYRLTDKPPYRPEELAEWKDELAAWKDRGVVGFKIWAGLSAAIDDPISDPTFGKMEEIGMVGVSVHIAQPYPTKWCEDPVEFWKSQNAWQRVLDRYPNLVVVNAHMLDLFNSDEQLDYLRYMLETYPNVNVELGARFQQFHMMDRDNLRKFMIKYSDRILFGTDISSQPQNNAPKEVAERYMRCFKLLETDETVKGGFFIGEDETKGLALPQEVLEKIYYKNASRLYPRVKDVLKELGYSQ